MATTSPLNPQHESAGAVLIPYGPDGAGIPVAAVFRSVEIEYAAIRKHAAILDLPQRGTLEITGADRLDFLGRMLTQDLRNFAPFTSRRSFWLNRKGRIDADLRLLNLGDRLVVDLDAHAVERTIAGLGAYIITEDVVITDRTAALHRLALHGPAAGALLAATALPCEGSAGVAGLEPGAAAAVRIAGADCTVERADTTGDPGYELTVPAEHAAAVWGALARPPADQPLDAPGRALDPRRPEDAAKAIPAGWHAYNIARIEAGSPLYYVDFGPDSLPHETGVLSDRVSFTKGCYLGQEIVARMQALGHPKQRIVALGFPDAPPATAAAPGRQPMTGAPVFASNAPDAPVVGAVTSSAISPMLGSRPVCFAMVKHAHTPAGTEVFVHAEGGEPMRAVVQPNLAFWSRR